MALVRGNLHACFTDTALFFLLYLVFKNDTLVNYYDIVLSFEYSSEFLSKQRFISPAYRDSFDPGVIQE